MDVPILKVGEVDVSDHAFTRIKERTDYNFRDKNQAVHQFRIVLKQAICLGETIDDEGSPGIMYAKDRTAIILSLDLKTIKTVYRHEQVTHDPIKEKVKEIHERELRKLRRREKCIERRNGQEQLKLHIELAELEYRQFKTRSDTVKKQCKARKKEIEQQMWHMENELKKIKDTIRQVSKSMVSVV